MSDSYFDALRAAGEYPRKGYGWLSPQEKRKEIIGKISRGYIEPWVLKEAKRFGIEYENKNEKVRIDN